MLEGFKAWFRNPAGTADGEFTASDLFLLIGFILCCIIAWKLILSHIVAD